MGDCLFLLAPPEAQAVHVFGTTKATKMNNTQVSYSRGNSQHCLNINSRLGSGVRGEEGRENDFPLSLTLENIHWCFL